MCKSHSKNNRFQKTTYFKKKISKTADFKKQISKTTDYKHIIFSKTTDSKKQQISINKKYCNTILNSNQKRNRKKNLKKKLFSKNNRFQNKP